MDRMVKVTYKDQITKDFPAGTTLKEISHSFQKYYNYPILVAKVDNHIDNLSKTIDRRCKIDFFDRSSVTGNSVYSSSIQFVLVLAVKRLFGKEVDVRIEHSIDKGIYCELDNHKLDKVILEKMNQVALSIVQSCVNHGIDSEDWSYWIYI